MNMELTQGDIYPQPLGFVGDRVEVRQQPTVVQLNCLDEPDSRWITENYYLTEDVRSHLHTIGHYLQQRRGCGFFVIGHYGSGKSHFLAYLSRQITGGCVVSGPPALFPISLVHFRSQLSLEEVVEKELGLSSKSHDRRVIWAQLKGRFPQGVVLIFDELSEFLRSKGSPQSFNEDIRFLQFLGERAQNEPLWIIAALQESIEHTGEMERDLFRKIKDRFPYRLLLTPTHVKDLIGKQLLVKKADYGEAIDQLIDVLGTSFPKMPLSRDELRLLYPLHPATIEILEEVRDCFSQARGVVEFVTTQLVGDPAKKVPPFLEQPWGRLVTPDLIVTHFMDLLEAQPEFLLFSQKVLPYYRKNMNLLFESAGQREMAWRLLHLLILVYLSPQRRALTAQQATFWLLHKVSSLHPRKNQEIVEKILLAMSEDGAFVEKKGATFAITDSQEDGKSFERLFQQVVDELKTRGDSLFEILMPLLNLEDFNPFSLATGEWQTKLISWHFHDRPIEVALGPFSSLEASLSGTKSSTALWIALPWGQGEEETIQECYRIQPQRIVLSDDLIELAALKVLSERAMPYPVKEKVQRLLQNRKEYFSKLVWHSYREVNLIAPNGFVDRVVASENSKSLSHWLSFFGERILTHKFPQFSKFAPSLGPLPKESLRQLLKSALEGEDFLFEDVPLFVKQIREGYLVPMGLIRRHGNIYHVIQDLDRHELVGHLLRILPNQPDPKGIYEFFMEPIYGLVPDQIHVLLIFLFLQGDIDLLKGGASYRSLFQQFPLPNQYDKILIGKGLDFNGLIGLKELCHALKIDLPQQMSVYVQRQLVRKLQRKGERFKIDMEKFFLQLQGIEEGELSERVQQLISYWNALGRSGDEIEAFEQFFYEIESLPRFLVLHREMTELPPLFERLSKDVAHLKYLFSHPGFVSCLSEELQEELRRLGEAPNFTESEKLRSWVNVGQKLYQRYQVDYRGNHDQGWKVIQELDIWRYEPPVVAHSRHVNLSETLQDFESVRAQAKQAICRGISGLEFQPVCRCGWAWGEHPIMVMLQKLEKFRDHIEKELRLFFQQEQVRKKIEFWREESGESDISISSQVESYLKGKSDFPKIESITLFDQYVSGVTTVVELSLEPLFSHFLGRTWNKVDLIQKLSMHLHSIDQSQIRLVVGHPRSNEDILFWSVKMALVHGQPLPQNLTSEEYALISTVVEKGWIGPAALRNLENLHLGEATLNKILQWILQGEIEIIDGLENSPLVLTARSFLSSSSNIDSLQEYGFELLRCYQFHSRFFQLKKKRWLDFLNKLASWKPSKEPQNLMDYLKEHVCHQWLVVDSLGILFEPLFRSQTSFGHWKFQSSSVVSVSPTTTTEAFYQQLIESHPGVPFEKFNGLDRLIHEERDFEELIQRAQVELELGFKKISKRLDPSEELLIFGDHGFRLTQDGKQFGHGGSSTPERLVLAVHLVPW